MMRIQDARLVAVCGKRSQFPETDLPEVAMIGKSNVGKSSLINALCGRKALARISQSPGKTRTINFYQLDQKLMLVDLPGYGYAKVSREEQQQWGKLIEGYLKSREQLKGVVLLIDIRHEPGAGDLQMYEWLSYYELDPLIAVTKKDKIKRSQLDKQLTLISKTLQIENKSSLIPVSAETKEGIDALWEGILHLL